MKRNSNSFKRIKAAIRIRIHLTVIRWTLRAHHAGRYSSQLVIHFKCIVVFFFDVTGEMKKELLSLE